MADWAIFELSVRFGCTAQQIKSLGSTRAKHETQIQNMDQHTSTRDMSASFPETLDRKTLADLTASSRRQRMQAASTLRDARKRDARRRLSGFLTPRTSSTGASIQDRLRRRFAARLQKRNSEDDEPEAPAAPGSHNKVLHGHSDSTVWSKELDKIRPPHWTKVLTKENLPDHKREYPWQKPSCRKGTCSFS